LSTVKVDLSFRVARFFIIHNTKNGAKYTIKTKKLSTIPKFTPIGIFGLKTYPLATLDLSSRIDLRLCVLYRFPHNASVGRLSWHNITKRGIIYQMTTTFTKWP
jgi:hypothetical protein